MLAVILAATVGGLYVRPFGAKDWQVASAGAAVAWVVGPLGIQGGIDAIAHSTNLVAFFFGLMLISAGAEAAGLYQGTTRLIDMVPPSRPRLIAVAGASVGITAVLSNDATPLVLTPAVLTERTRRNGFSRYAALTVTFMADGASLLLPFTNPVNLLFFDRFDLSFGQYLADITPAAAAGAFVMAVILCARLPEELPEPSLGGPRTGGGQTLWAVGVVALLAGAYAWAGYAELPLGTVTVAGGLAMCGIARMGGTGRPLKIRSHVSFGVLTFVAALLVLVKSVSDANTFSGLGEVLGHLESQPALATILSAAVVAMVLSNLMNNWPAALVMVAVIAGVPGNHHTFVAGALIGSTIGANLTILGSLSTVFWLNLSANARATFSAAEYARRALVPTLAGLGAACLIASLLQ